MENVVLVIHLLLALALIGVVLLQRSEGGGLGMGGGGGGGGGGLVSSRGAATALGKLTWALAVGFIATSLTLTIFAAQNAADSSVLDRLGGTDRGRRCRRSSAAGRRPSAPAAPRYRRYWHRRAPAPGRLTADHH